MAQVAAGAEAVVNPCCAKLWSRNDGWACNVETSVTQEITSPTPEDSRVPRRATLRYKVWGVGYLILLPPCPCIRTHGPNSPSAPWINLS
jgi:hypothetical protein